MEDLVFESKHFSSHQLGPGVSVGKGDGGGGVNILREGGREGGRDKRLTFTVVVIVVEERRKRREGWKGGKGRVHTSNASTSTSSKHILAWCQKVFSSHICTKLGR